MAIKKQWYDIVAPIMFGEVVVGETMAFDPKNLVGRKIKVNLTELGKDYQKFFMKMIFKIEAVDKSRALTKFVGHDVTAERIYRMVQRRARRVDCVTDVKTSDGIQVRLKAIVILTQRVGTSVKNAAREKAKKVIENFVSGITLEVLIKSIIDDQLQKMIREECKKIYPVGAVEIRKSELL
ncbi:MAG: 30S ribosomal protein S3ae [Candidatus Aenigmarchaeota archaeon]|nr:30S ribosomal protein S3ae [Candidatus Aenigmarchaeota archaeon]